jgi:hypothetical protein
LGIGNPTFPRRSLGQGILVSMRRVVGLALAFAFGCAQGDGNSGRTSNPFGPVGEDPTTSAAEGTSGDETGSTEAEAGQSDAHGGTETGEGPDACEVEPDDEACVVCAKQRCCLAVTDCSMQPQCACALECIEAGGKASECEEMCGQTNEGVAVMVCAYLNCETECEDV